MNPWDLSASDLLVWGIVLHLIADWPLQNDWMAKNKMYWNHSLAGWVHAGIHGLLLSVIFGWLAISIAAIHLIIDTRTPVVWWSKLIGQTQPKMSITEAISPDGEEITYEPIYDVGLEVRFWTDQVFHIITIAGFALLAGV